MIEQRWSRGPKARSHGQGHKKNPRPSTAFPRTEPLEAKDTGASVLQTKDLQNFIQAISKREEQ